MRTNCLVLLFVIEVTYVAESYDARHPSFGTADRFKAEDKYHECVYGRYQTPIHVRGNMYEYMIMPAIDFIGYNNYLPSPITLTNTGKTVKLTAGQYLEGGLYSYPSIAGGLLSSDYVWESLHFHWGRDNDRGSEHIINNVRYPMEMHIVHKKRQYQTREEALRYKDGLAVLAIFFELTFEDNRKLRPIIQNLKYVREEGNSTIMDKTFSLFTLLPRDTNFFFTYEGSLTTPPCHESVVWILFPQTVKISFDQMEQFRGLSIPENFRRVQPVGSRRVFLRQTKRFIRSGFDELLKKNISSNLFWLNLR